MKISKFLTLAELTTSQTAIRKGIDNTPNKEVIDNLKLVGSKVFDPLREAIGQPIKISSGYRSPKLNAAIGSKSKNSQHVTGQALDLQAMNGVKNSELYKWIKDNLEFDQLIWEYGTSKEPAWVHVSYKKSGNRKQLLKIGV